MNSNFIITFFVGIAIYLFGLGVFSFIKFLVNKRKAKKEILKNEESKQVKDNNSKE